MWWMWGDGHMWGWWGWLLMPFMMALVWVPLLLLFAWGARVLFGTGALGTSPAAPPTPPTMPEPDARELARRAYARGDLPRERFVQIIEDLDHTEGATR
jgi:uncharacterized membrane protein